MVCEVGLLFVFVLWCGGWFGFLGVFLGLCWFFLLVSFFWCLWWVGWCLGRGGFVF